VTGLLVGLLVAIAVCGAFYGVLFRRARRDAEASLDQSKVQATRELQAAAVERQLQNEDTARFNTELESKLRDLAVGARVKFRLSDGSDVWIKIRSERLKHESGAWGWEALFEDDGEIGFADERRVVASGFGALS
jgi:hypothetical protein